MLQTLRELRLHAALLILACCSTLTGLVTLIVDVAPELTVPERLMLTTQGAPAIILSGLALLALGAQKPVWR